MAGRGCWRKRMPLCNGADRSCNITPPCKRADFQRVIHDEKLAEPSQEETANERRSIRVCILRPSGRWDQIDWTRCERQVRRLQARIVKAIQEGRWGKVKALQRLLTCSFHGKALAVKRVTENQGKRTSGVDGKFGAPRRPDIKPSARCGGAAINRNRCGVFTSRKPTAN